MDAQQIVMSISSLDIVVIHQIFQNLPADDLARASCVCKEWKIVSTNEALWEHAYRRLDKPAFITNAAHQLDAVVTGAPCSTISHPQSSETSLFMNLSPLSQYTHTCAQQCLAPLSHLSLNKFHAFVDEYGDVQPWEAGGMYASGAIVSCTFTMLASCWSYQQEVLTYETPI